MAHNPLFPNGSSQVCKVCLEYTHRTHLHQDHAHALDLTQQHVEGHIRLCHFVINDADGDLLLKLASRKLELALQL